MRWLVGTLLLVTTLACGGLDADTAASWDVRADVPDAVDVPDEAPAEATPRPASATAALPSAAPTAAPDDAAPEPAPAEEPEPAVSEPAAKPAPVEPDAPSEERVRRVAERDGADREDPEPAAPDAAPVAVEDGEIRLRTAAGVQLRVDGVGVGFDLPSGSFVARVPPGEHEVEVFNLLNQRVASRTVDVPAGRRVELRWARRRLTSEGETAIE